MAMVSSSSCSVDFEPEVSSDETDVGRNFISGGLSSLTLTIPLLLSLFRDRVVAAESCFRTKE